MKTRKRKRSSKTKSGEGTPTRSVAEDTFDRAISELFIGLSADTALLLAGDEMAAQLRVVMRKESMTAAELIHRAFVDFYADWWVRGAVKELPSFVTANGMEAPVIRSARPTKHLKVQGHA